MPEIARIVVVLPAPFEPISVTTDALETSIELPCITMRDMGDRFINAWKRAEAGDVVEERHVTLSTWEEPTAALTPKRLEKHQGARSGLQAGARRRHNA
ncbi:hypothetical protein [Paraburkholderia sp. RL18-085-BIA-A]|uniref:hypothetical protein n=1 Tax=Paraburkholderia sp. RL18-085-BIA-A TaxID=3031633 RepID=UPI0038B6C30A